MRKRFVGSVVNLVGRLGCIICDKDRGFVSGSLECKHDAVCAGILASRGGVASEEKTEDECPKRGGFFVGKSANA